MDKAKILNVFDEIISAERKYQRRDISITEYISIKQALAHHLYHDLPLGSALL